jgi:NTP pyrophosphatase (non-canonical NTP hydrolase)
MVTIDYLSTVVHRTAIEKGWWPMGEPTAYNMENADEINFSKVNIPEKLCLMHEEISEVLKEYRAGRDVREIYYNESEPKKPEGIPIEFADEIIRILDFCKAYGINIEQALELKMEYNKTRSYRHGGKKC